MELYGKNRNDKECYEGNKKWESELFHRLLSIVKTTLATEPLSHFTLFYGNRASGTVMFKEELAALKDTYLNAAFWFAGTTTKRAP